MRAASCCVTSIHFVSLACPQHAPQPSHLPGIKPCASFSRINEDGLRFIEYQSTPQTGRYDPRTEPLHC